MSKTITRKYIQRITKREGNTNIRQSSGGGGGGGGGASQYWVEENYISKLFFNQLFTVYDEDGNVVEPNDTESVIASIKSMFGFWTDAYLSALGNGEGGGAELTLASLADVDVHGVSNGQALVYDATTQKWVPGQGGGIDITAMWSALAQSGVQQIDASHLATALTGYATETWVGNQGYITGSALNGYATESWVGSQISDMATQTWVSGNYLSQTNAAATYLTQTNAAATYLTKSDAATTYVSIAFFERLFKAYNGSTVIHPNNTTSTIDNIKAMFGFWTDFYLSALGNGSGGSTPGVTMAQVWSALGNSTTEQINISHLTTALSGYNPTSNFKTINGNSIIGTGDIVVSGGGGTVSQIVVGTTAYDPVSGVVTLPAYPTSVTSANRSRYLETWNSDKTWTYGDNYKFYAQFNGNNVVVLKCDNYPIHVDQADLAGNANSANLALNLYKGRNDAISTPSTYMGYGIGIMSESGSMGSDWGLRVVSIPWVDYTGGFPTAFFISKARIKVNQASSADAWGSWNTIAYTTDNVASATKLETARTLWGQSFDGSANVSGDMTGVGSISASGNINTTSGSLSTSRYVIINAWPNYGTNSGSIWFDGRDNVKTFVFGGTLNISLGDSGAKLWHSVNDGSGSGLDADLLDGQEGSYYAKATDVTTLQGYFTNGVANNAQNSVYTNYLKCYYSGAFHTENRIYANWINGRYELVEQTANYTVYVALSGSAVKLQTSRTIWGQSFDGSANVSGSITGATTIDASSNVSVGGTLSVTGNSTLTGYVGIGTAASSSYALKVSGVAYASTGFYSGGYVTALSDIRHKDVKGNVGLSVGEVANAPSVKFLWKDRRQEGLQVGSIAQYWQKVMPEAIVKNADGELTMSYGVIALLASIATARKVEDHERRIRELEEENKKLKKQLNVV